ncbi:NADH-ubiquinone oxidoreductase [Histoplasma capsulatum]|uniref:NADH-ubiquinone oxidoreductase n=2 Tax=Histoplasma TaxID=5036 RepID=A0A8A1MNZ4_AJECA|nr:NADH-ubiquinone oxidoreductase [Histoplasma capsulatum]
MPKRKRGDHEESSMLSNQDDRRLRIQIARLEQKLEHGCQLIFRALKTARGFERQKLGRRQKTSKQKNETAQLSRIGEEIQALKALDLGVTAERHLLKHLVRTKRIAESPAFSRFLSARKPRLEGPQNGPEANVIARLFNSNPVRNVLPGITNDIRHILGISDSVLTAKPMDRENPPPNPKGSEIVEEGPASKLHQAYESDLEMEDAYIKQYNAQLASSSESEPETDDQGKDENDHHSHLTLAGIEPPLSPTSSIVSLEPTSKTTTKTSKPNNKNAETAFLPSLTMGGYWSGSESAEEDAAAAAIQPRKNRMGQQARRKLWEKKFGSGANHLKNQPPEKEKSRDSGWDMRRGALSRDETRGKRGRGGLPGALSSRRPKVESAAQAPNPNFEQRRNRQDSEQKPLHPSWEAAKKAKAWKAQASFQGKKITFD